MNRTSILIFSLLDKWLGPIVCLLCTLVLKVVSVFGSSKYSSPKKILILKLLEQGATVVALPAIRSAIEIVGEKNVYMWIFDENRPILDAIKVIPEENVFVVPQSNPIFRVFFLIKNILEIRSEKIDTVVDFESFSRGSALLTFLTGARNRCGFHRFNSSGPYRGDLMTHKMPYHAGRHAGVVYLSLIEMLKFPPNNGPQLDFAHRELPYWEESFLPSPEESLSVSQKLKQAGFADSQLILLNANTSDLLPLRRWGGERFVSLARELLLSYPKAAVIWVGHKSESDQAKKLSEAVASPRSISLAGEFTFSEYLTLLNRADLLVTNDSGPAHFSSLTNTARVVLFGPETPDVFAPLGDKVEIVWKDLACSPCVSANNHRISNCRDNICMQKISVEEVLAACKRQLESDRVRKVG